MATYIDKDALLHKMQERHEDLSRDYGDYDNYVTGFGDEIELLENASTVDVQEVKHGYWIGKELDNFRKVECSCSICGWSGVENYDSYVDIHDFEFCPNCGAKMESVKGLEDEE